MMLPGVELARRRRVHHGHEILTRGPQDSTAARRLLVSQREAMDESAAIARQRLEEKLRSFSSVPPPSPSSSSPSSAWSNLLETKAKRDGYLKLGGASKGKSKSTGGSNWVCL